MRFLSAKVIVGALIVAAIGVYVWISRPAEISAETARAIRRNVVQEVSVTGTVKSVRGVDLAFERSGRVQSVLISVGDRVSAGQRLVALDSDELRAQLREAEANVLSQRARLSELERGTRQEELVIAETRVTAARDAAEDAQQGLFNALQDAYTKSDDAIRNKADQFFRNPRSDAPELILPSSQSQAVAQLEQNRRSLETLLTTWKASLGTLSLQGDLLSEARSARDHLNFIKSFLDTAALIVNALSPTSEISQTTIDKYRADVSTARTNVNAAISNVTSAEEKLRTAQSGLAVVRTELELKQAGAAPEQIEAQRASVVQAEARVAVIASQIERNILRAPFSGTITRQDAKVGEILPANKVIVSLISETDYEIETNVPEADIAKIKIGDTARVTLDAYGSDELFEARVVSRDLAETILEGVATYKVKLSLSDGTQRILPGMTANIDILTNRRENVIAIPSRAVFMVDGVRMVRIIADNEIRETPVIIGLRGSDGFVEITEGLQEGDEVVLFLR